MLILRGRKEKDAVWHDYCLIGFILPNEQAIALGRRRRRRRCKERENSIKAWQRKCV